MAEGVVIRPERDADYPVIAEVVRAAFVGHPDEVASFVERIRASEQFIPELALVAEDSSGVIAHVMLSWVGVEGGSRTRILNLTPMSVRPDRQRIGVGARLIRDALGRARHATANLENVWNGRPISKIVLAEPLAVLDGIPVSLIELIPPVHQRVYRMGLEHLGIVVGADVDAFSRKHRAVLAGQQFQERRQRGVLLLFGDFSHVEFYGRSLYDACVLGAATFDGFVHVDDWGPAAPRDRDPPEPAAAVTQPADGVHDRPLGERSGMSLEVSVVLSSEAAVRYLRDSPGNYDWRVEARRQRRDPQAHRRRQRP